MSGMFNWRFGRTEAALMMAMGCCLMSVGWAHAQSQAMPRLGESPLGSSSSSSKDDDEEEGTGLVDRMGDSIKKTFTNAGKSMGISGKPEGPPPAESPSGCPTIALVDGTISQRVMAAGASGNQGVRYQFSLGNVGRQCTVSGGRVAIKVGADGRVLLGPAGSAGRFDVPIRVVVFNEAQQKPVASKLYRVPASIGQGQSGAPFQFVSDDIVVPTSGNASREYSIKVGIDAGKGGADVAEAKKGHRRRQKPVASASQ